MSAQLAGTASLGVRSLVSGPRRGGRVIAAFPAVARLLAAGHTSGADLAWASRQDAPPCSRCPHE